MTADERAKKDPAETERPGAKDSGFQKRGQPSFALRHRDRDLPLVKNEVIIGRSELCDLVLDGPLISRRHARLVVTDQSVVVEDMGSRNGVFVNSIQIRRPVLLKAGDVILIGDQSLEVVARRENPKSGRVTSPAPNATSAAPRAPRLPRFDEEDDSPTRGVDAFDLLRTAVDRAFAQGRADEAERMLRMHLETLLEQVRGGRRPPLTQCTTAALHAAKLAATTRKAEYLNYPFQLYHHLSEPLPVVVVDELYQLIRQVRGLDRALLRKYVALLRSKAATLGPSERFALQRIEGLERLASL